MEITAPEYYGRFRCLAGACPDSCCKEWEVEVDDASAAFYRTLPGPLGDDLRSVLRTQEDVTCFAIQNGRCPMWQADGLCRIQAQLSHDALCATCRSFPRLRHDYGTFAELDLELSCPEAARLIFAEAHPALTHETVPGGEDPDYDAQTMDILRQSRESALALVNTSTLSVPEALACLLLYGHDVQSALDGGALQKPEISRYLQCANRHADAPDTEAFLNFFRNLEILTQRWNQRLSTPEFPEKWPDSLRRLAGYSIRRYWLQAVSDYDLVCRVKLIVSACILVQALGGDTVQTAQLFSKEIENDPDNVEAILDGAYTAPALTDRNLLSLLLG